MIDKFEVRQNYHNQAIIISLMTEDNLFGVIIDDSPDDYCRFVRNPNLREYKETKKESLVEIL